MIYYITNYATKLETPTWKRIALAEEVMRLVQEQNNMDTQGSTNLLHRLLNKIGEVLQVF
jgi:translation initiation factor 2 alpha subunit (eIF-2alpha)